MNKKVFYFLCLLTLLFPSKLWAQEPYAVVTGYETNGQTLTFYYDDQKENRGGMEIGPFAEYDNRPWGGDQQLITEVVFDTSFAGYTELTSTAYWFASIASLNTINGIKNLKTDNVTDMREMFAGCMNLTSLDLSRFYTSNVTDMQYMFAGCDNLTTIYVGNGWDVSKVTNSDEMFSGCFNLKGGAGTEFNQGQMGVTYAHVDGGENNPGYLTYLEDLDARKEELNMLIGEIYERLMVIKEMLEEKDPNRAATELWETLNQLEEEDVEISLSLEDAQTEADLDDIEWKIEELEERVSQLHEEVENYGLIADAEPYAVLSDNNTVLTFYYDDQKAARGGININTSNNVNYGGATKAVFDASFADYRPISTANWFYFCSSLTSITGMEYLNTDNVKSMSSMFHGCSKLTSIDVSGFKTENVMDMSFMFYDCRSLTSLDVGGFKTDNVTRMNGMFYGCLGLTSLDVSGFKTDNVTRMDEMFYNCRSLTSLDVSGFNTSNVTNMAGMFEGCRSLTSLDVSGFNTQKVSSMHAMFSGCTGLTSLDVSGFNTQNVLDMGWLFYNCSSLTSLELSSFNTQKVWGMSEMFYGCSGLTNIYAGANWDTDAVTSDSGMFGNCTNLIGGRGTVFTKEHTGVEYAHIDGGANNPGYLASHDDFEAWKHELIERLIEIHIQIEGITAILQEKDPNQTATELWQTIHDIDEDAITIQSMIDDAQTVTELEDCEWKIEELEHRVEILREEVENYRLAPEAELYAVLSGGSTNMMLRFYYDTNKVARGGMSVGPFTSSMTNWFDNRAEIKTVEIDASVRNCDILISTAYWFWGMSNLTAIEGIQYLNTQNVTDMRYMFYNCSSLTNLNVSNFNTQNVTDMGEMFYGCSGLTNLNVSNFNTQNVTNMGEMFYGCSSLTNLNLSNFNTLNVTNMSRFFYNCSSLTSLDVTGFETDNVTNMRYMFYNCSSLTNLNMSGFNTTNVADMIYMFSNCSGLTSLDLSGFKTDKVKDMSRMFRGCSNLTTIMVGSNWNTDKVENGNDMFYGCTNLKGGRGTSYTQLHVGIEYAHVDGGANNPGYFASHDDFEAWKHELIERLIEIHIQIEGITAILQEKDPNQTATELWQTIHDIDEDVITIQSIIDDAQTVTELEDYEWKIEELEHRVEILREEVENYGETTDPIAYGVFTNNMRKLTFYYDENMGTHNEGIVIPWEQLLNSNEMNNARQTLEIIDFDPSFANLTTLTTVGYLFAGCMNLTQINGLEYLVTDNMTDMREMFASCESLTELDLRTFNTSKVTMMWGMFQGCIHLNTIIVGSGWTTAALTDEGHEMFAGCTSLVGGMGTTYSNEHFDADYAHIDGGPSNPGYLTGTEEPVITEFEVDGIFYRVHDQAEHRVTVAHVMHAEDELFVPFEVEYARIHWIVTALGEMAFTDLEQVKVIGVPESIDSVSVNLFNHCPHLAAIIWNANVPLTTAAIGQLNNPNLLLYITNTTNAPTNITNVIDLTTNTANKIVLSDAEAGGNDFYCPEPFFVRDISYTHSYDQATQIGICQGWESIVVPFDVQTYTHETKGEIYPISTLLDEQIELDGDKPFWLYAFTSNDEFVEADRIRANTPYIISMPNDPAYWDDYILSGRVTFGAKDVEVYPTRNAFSVESQSRVFVPNFENMDYENPDIFLLNVGDAYENHLPGSIFSGERPARRARPFEAYFIPTGNYPARYMDIFSSEVDAIHEIPMSSKTKEGIYDLMGRRVKSEEWRVEGNNSSTHQLQKGVYIIDGKKVMVK